MNKISEILKKILTYNEIDEKTEEKLDTISIGEIKESLHETGFYIIMMLFALPLSIPIPIPPGYTTIFAVPLFLFSLQILIGLKTPWLPKYLSKKRIKRSILSLIISKSSYLIIKLEQVTRLGRLSFITSYSVCEYIIAFFCLLFSISIAIPLPMTNFIPAVGIILISVGKITKDGLFVIIGILIGVIGLWITTFIIFLGADIIAKITKYFTEKYSGTNCPIE